MMLKLLLIFGGGVRPRGADFRDRLRTRPSCVQAIPGYPHPLISYGAKRIQQAKVAKPAQRHFLEGASS